MELFSTSEPATGSRRIASRSYQEAGARLDAVDHGGCAADSGAAPSRHAISDSAGRSAGVLRESVIVEALNSLSQAHREILNETVIRNRTVNEAAYVLGIPSDTAKARVYYALRTLRIVLEERGVAI